MASIQNLYETVVGVLGDQASKVISALGEITVECLPEHYVSVMTTLRDHEELHFELLVDLCGVDYSTYKNEVWQGKRFAVVSQLLSVKNNQRIRVRVWVSDDDFPRSRIRRRYLQQRGLVRTRSLRYVRHHVQQPPGLASHPDRLWFRRTSVPQRLPDFRLCGNALRRRAKTRDLPTCYH